MVLLAAPGGLWDWSDDGSMRGRSHVKVLSTLMSIENPHSECGPAPIFCVLPGV